jgi:hypothetical protein
MAKVVEALVKLPAEVARPLAVAVASVALAIPMALYFGSDSIKEVVRNSSSKQVSEIEKLNSKMDSNHISALVHFQNIESRMSSLESDLRSMRDEVKNVSGTPRVRLRGLTFHQGGWRRSVAEWTGWTTKSRLSEPCRGMPWSP